MKDMPETQPQYIYLFILVLFLLHDLNFFHIYNYYT